ncbi:IS66 family transposase [Aliikangiella maris]|uniref:Transposase n=2 Tax=Aliikangiella maris TaxID=3162458 RepID=A0ABV3MJM9_9GAMM
MVGISSKTYQRWGQPDNHGDGRLEYSREPHNKLSELERQRHSGEDIAILAQRKQVYLKAKEKHPERWSKEIKDWDVTGDVYLNSKKGKRLNRINWRHNLYLMKTTLLKCLVNPSIPLHNNLSESDIREFVKRRKISGCTKSDNGRDSTLL